MAPSTRQILVVGDLRATGTPVVAVLGEWRVCELNDAHEVVGLVWMSAPSISRDDAVEEAGESDGVCTISFKKAGRSDDADAGAGAGERVCSGSSNTP